MPETDLFSEDAFLRALRNHLADIRLRVDLGEITSAAAFRAALEQGGRFRLDDPRVRTACVGAGFAGWMD
jgi:hypothetical protein